MTDISLKDLSAGEVAQDPQKAKAATEAAGEAAEAEKGTGEWLSEVIDKLDEKGLIEPILFGPDSNISQESSPDQAANVDPKEAPAEIDAEQIAKFGKLTIDYVGDVPISEIVKLAEEEPEKVNQLIETQLGGD